MWLHGYESIEGNEIADKSAKQGATASFYGPGLIVGLENRYRIAEVRKWEKTQLDIDWSKILDKQKGFLRFLDLSKDKAYHKPLPIKASLKKMKIAAEDQVNSTILRQSVRAHAPCNSAEGFSRRYL